MKKQSRPDSPEDGKKAMNLCAARAEIIGAEADTSSSEEAQKRITELQDFIAGQETDITEFDEALGGKSFIEKITTQCESFSVKSLHDGEWLEPTIDFACRLLVNY